jgi:hypothetical protein
MAALVTGHGNAVRVFLNCTFYNFMHTPVVAQMNDFGTFTLHDPAHYINGCIMTVK